jgi:hypothetical protein
MEALLTEAGIHDVDDWRIDPARATTCERASRTADERPGKTFRRPTM